MPESMDTSNEASKDDVEPPNDIVMTDNALPSKKRKHQSKIGKGHEINSMTIKKPAWSYLHLSLMAELPSKPQLDILTVKQYITAALNQFLGLTGSSISVDILKVEQNECWIRVPRQDARAVTAAVGSWIGGSEKEARKAWKVKGSGNWLGALVGRTTQEKVWSG